jgi:hypothetical protein
MTVIKICKQCGWKASADFFQKDRSKKDGFRPECKPCTSLNRKKTLSTETIRKRNLEKNFGKGALDIYQKLFEKQGGVCAICKSPENGRYNHLSIDHCHETEKIRGLLCNNCNRGIGLLKDNPEFLKNAVKYLEIF